MAKCLKLKGMRMAKSEILDIVDKEGNVTGQAPRDEFHSNPDLIHRVTHCWIFNNQGQILWQQRSLKKKLSPGKWDMSCGGHIPAGETPEDSLHRELEEELGIKNAKPIFVEKYTLGNDKQTEMIYLYYLIINQPAEDFILQEEEVEQVKWIDVEEAQTSVLTNKVEATDWVFSQIAKIFQHIFIQCHGDLEMKGRSGNL
jgi:isopentenyl-diphosphate delta-isomerase type 1